MSAMGSNFPSVLPEGCAANALRLSQQFYAELPEHSILYVLKRKFPEPSSQSGNPL
jgi:hypothetical protein